MDSLLYMGVRITPASRPCETTPGAWLPSATLLEVASGKALQAITDDQSCDTREEADVRALRLGKRHVMKVLHQG